MPIPPDTLALIGTGAKWLAGAAAPTVAVWRLLSHDRTLLYALLPWVAKKVDARKKQETLVAESQKAYANELKSLAKQTDLHTQRFLKAKPTQRPLIQRDLEYLESRKREVEVKFAAVNDIAADTTKRDEGKQVLHSAAISGHGMDQFDELVRRRNEDWRASLLKDALVREAREPGSIPPRLLWLVGLLESDKFEVLSALLNLTSTIDGRPIIPGQYALNDRNIVPGLEKRKWVIGMAVSALSDTGLVEDFNIALNLDEGESIVAYYDTARIELTSLGLDGRVMGVMFTSLGKKLADIYRATPNSVGQDLFDRWVKDHMNYAGYKVKRL